MKKPIVLFAGMLAVGCLLGALIPKEEAVVDGLAQNARYLFMEKREKNIELEWVPEEKAWLLPASETYVPVQGIPIDEDKAQLNKLIIAMLGAYIEEALTTHNPGLWYRLDSAYVDVITECVGKQGQYRIVVNINTENTIERLVFDVAPDTKPELIRYSQMRL